MSGTTQRPAAGRDAGRRLRRRILAISLVVVAAAVLVPVIGATREIVQSQRADYGWRPKVPAPAFTTTHPVAVIDEAHNNASTAAFTGRYWQFGRLLRADGYRVRRGKRPFAAGSLDGVQVLVVANASGAPKPQFMGVNLPVRTEKTREEPAFTAEEIDVLTRWVQEGGSLLLVADHAPFGAASADLAAAFGVTMHQGFVEVPDERSDPLLFSQENGRLGDHSILAGGGPGTAVGRVMTFTGQSLDGPPGSAVLLRLPGNAVEYVRPASGAGDFTEEPAGGAQGVALEWGKGRVVVLGEAAMLTAQVSKRQRFGMNMPGNDNQQFALNVMHWLSRVL